MNKVWQEPQVMVQPFVANEYVAACYRIRCRTPKDNGYFGYLFDDSNHNGVWDSKDKVLMAHPVTEFQGCNECHSNIIRDEAPAVNGFVTNDYFPTTLLGQPNTSYGVFWWEENLGSTYDYHVMTPGAENYETNPNAS